MSQQHRILVLAFLCIWSISSLNGQVKYSNFSSFKNAVVSAKAGDEIILTDGTYTPSSMTLTEVKGTESQPILIRAETIGGVTFNDETYIDLQKCEYVTFQGFVFNITEESTTIKLQASNHIRITQNVFDGAGEAPYTDDASRESSVWINIQGLWGDDVTLSHHNMVDHNLFRNKHTLGNMIRIDGTGETFVSQYDVITFNHFKNMGPRAQNEMEAIRVGWSAMSESDGFTEISNNLFEACNGDPEIISVKCNKNTIAHNTFRRCEGTLSLRHGNNSLVEGNFFLGEDAPGTGGVRIYGSDHRIINNHFEGLTGTKWDAPITLTEGDAEEGNGSLTKHFRIERAIIANNTLVNNLYGIEIGYDNQGKYSKPPRDVILAYNIVSGSTNSLVKYINAPSNISWVNNLMHSTGTSSVGEGVSFLESEVKLMDPNLEVNPTHNYFKTTASSPSYMPSQDVAGNIPTDIEGQKRTLPTNYGSDHFSTEPASYSPLSAKNVGPSTGEFLFLGLSSFSFTVQGGQSNISISSNLDWKASSDVDWLHLDKYLGSADGSLLITADKNATGAIRTASVTVESTNISEGTNIIETVNITQAESDPPHLETSTTTLHFDADNSNREITINSNVSWTINSDEDWILPFPRDGKDTSVVIVSVTANESLSKRMGLLSISDGATVSISISVTQDGIIGTEKKLNIISAIASTEQSGNEAANTIDGIFTNRWSGEGDGAYITLDLGALTNVSFLKAGIYKSSSRGTKFDILTSADGITFAEALMGITSELSSDTLIIYDFDNVDVRYLRIVGHGNTTGSLWNSFTEFEIWGWDSGTSAIRSSRKGNSFQVIPNPSNGYFNVQGLNAGELSIFSLDGKKVYGTRIEESTHINTLLKKGIYLLRIRNDREIFTKKLIIR